MMHEMHVGFWFCKFFGFFVFLEFFQKPLGGPSWCLNSSFGFCPETAWRQWRSARRYELDWFVSTTLWFCLNMHLWFWVVLCMMDEPLLNSTCLSAFKLIKVCTKTQFFVFFCVVGTAGCWFCTARHQVPDLWALSTTYFSSLRSFCKTAFLDSLTVWFSWNFDSGFITCCYLVCMVGF